MSIRTWTFKNSLPSLRYRTHPVVSSALVCPARGQLCSRTIHSTSFYVCHFARLFRVSVDACWCSPDPLKIRSFPSTSRRYCVIDQLWKSPMVDISGYCWFSQNHFNCLLETVTKLIGLQTNVGYRLPVLYLFC